MLFKLLMLQLGFTCITAADKLRFFSQILSVYERSIEVFLFFVFVFGLFLLPKAEIC